MKDNKFQDIPLNKEGFCLVVLATLYYKVERKVYLIDAAISLFDDVNDYWTAKGNNMSAGITWKHLTTYFIDVTIDRLKVDDKIQTKYVSN